MSNIYTTSIIDVDTNFSIFYHICRRKSALLEFSTYASFHLTLDFFEFEQYPNSDSMKEVKYTKVYIEREMDEEV